MSRSGLGGIHEGDAFFGGGVGPLVRTYAGSVRRRRGWLDTDSNADSRADSYSNANPGSYADTHSDPDPNSHANSCTYGDCCGNGGFAPRR